MKTLKTIALGFAATFLLVTLTDAAQAKTATARIVRKCKARPAKIVIPSGKRAVKLRLLRLENGTKCVVGGKPKSRGFSIKKGGRFVYRYSQWKNKRPVERPVKLGKLTLGPGTYWMYVGGGRGAVAKVRYRLR